MIAALLLSYAFGVVGAMSLWAAALRADSTCMPGGGRAAVVVICLLWPLVIAIAVVGLVLYGVSEL